MKWTPEKIEELRRRYPHEDNGTLAREFGCSRKALVFRASHLGLRKTEAANEARYAAMSRRPAPPGEDGERRQIATGTLIVRGNVLIHLSNFSAARGDPERSAEEGAGQRDKDENFWPLEVKRETGNVMPTRHSVPPSLPGGVHPSPLSGATAAPSPFPAGT